MGLVGGGTTAAVPHARRLRIACLLAFAAALPVTAPAVRAGAGEPPAAFLDASADRVLARRTIPDPARRVGEVRLVARGAATVVQTLLSTKLMSRVTSEIRRKEEKHWPASAEGATDSAAYLAALEAVRDEIETREKSQPWDRRHPRILIEFAADATGQAVLLGTYAPGGADEDLPASREVLRILAPGRAWVLRDMRLILADSFDVEEAGVDAIGPLGPAATAAPGGAAAAPVPAALPAASQPAGPVETPPSSSGKPR